MRLVPSLRSLASTLSSSPLYRPPPLFYIRLSTGIRAQSTYARRMARTPMSVFFLGTSSGGGPSESRNCSSLVVDMGAGELTMVDCAEGTLRQFSLQPGAGEQRYKPLRVRTLLVTHMHADHIMGITTMLRHVLKPPWFDHTRDGDQPPAEPTFELYGPAGLRSFVRNCLFATRTRTAEKYAVHELLTEGDVTTSCAAEDLHGSEAPGRDIRAGEDGFWRECIDAGSTLSNMIVDAGPIIHRDPCIGYILREASAPFRKLVILGDTNDPSAITPLVLSLPGPPSSLLIHEATDAYIPPHVDYKANRTVETVMEKCLERAHSTPGMAGAFAKAIGAERLVLNHIGSRFPAPVHASAKGAHIRTRILQELADQATAAWGAGRPALAATDFLRVEVPMPGAVETVVPQPRPEYRGGGRRGGAHGLPPRPQASAPPYQPRGEWRGQDLPRGRGGRGGGRGRGGGDDRMDTFV